MKISELPLVELLKFKARFELPKNLRDSIMLRGIEAELSSREDKQPEDYWAELEDKDKEIRYIEKEKSDLEDEANRNEERADKLETFIRETISNINVNILDGKKSVATLKKEFVDLRNAARELLDSFN